MKVPGGKLVAIKVDFEQSIKKIQILGDFFLHPESSLADIEKSLTGLKITESEKSISDIIYSVMEKNNATMIGVSPDALARLIKTAVSS
jgi:hypothetical protein